MHARGHATSRGPCGLARTAARRPGCPGRPLGLAERGSLPQPKSRVAWSAYASVQSRSCGAGRLGHVVPHYADLEHRMALRTVAAAVRFARCTLQQPIWAPGFVLTAGGSVSGAWASCRVPLALEALWGAKAMPLLTSIVGPHSTVQLRAVRPGRRRSGRGGRVYG